jgi:hypothetical protein
MAKKKTKVKKPRKKKKVAQGKPLRGPDGRLLPGQCGNPNGRPKGSKNKFSIVDLSEAIKEVERRKRRKFLEVWVEAAWGNATEMAGIATFMMPKLRAVEQIVIPGDDMSDEEASEIREEMLRRFGHEIITPKKGESKK